MQTASGIPTPPYSFDDEFSGPAGADPNDGLARTYWFLDTCWWSGCGNQSPTQYASSNVELDGRGHLVLKAVAGSSAWCGDVACAYTSGALTMFNVDKQDVPSWSQMYGTFAARVKIVNSSRGLWPAVWIEGANHGKVGWPLDGEIDAFEAVGQQPTIVQQHIEGGHTLRTFGRGSILPRGESISGWHVYSVTWTPTGIQWSVDGHVSLTLTSSEVGSAWAPSFEHPFALRLDLTVGGNRPGPPDASSQFPAEMLVDWVRVSPDRS